jgi:hypothetical protein
MAPLFCRLRESLRLAIWFSGPLVLWALAAWLGVCCYCCLPLSPSGLASAADSLAIAPPSVDQPASGALAKGIPATVAAQDERTPPQVLDSRQLAGEIDAYFEQHWREHKIEPAPPADDAEYLRRVQLDLVGKIPLALEVTAFLDDRDDGKRAALVDKLLKRGACATHFANCWRTILLAGAAENLQTRALVSGLESWLKLRFAANTPYDQLASALLTATLDDGTSNRLTPADNGPSPNAFYQAAERKPEQLAAATSRVFLGLQVQCAQCHDHPHAHWTRQEFWSFAALFTDVAVPAGETSTGDASASEASASEATTAAADADEPARIMIPDTGRFASAAFLDGTAPQFVSGALRRAAMAEWLTEDGNRWFAAAAVNRLWEHFLGRGLIDPVDDLEAAKPADHPALLALLAQQFRLHHYDLHYLVRAITATRVYRHASRWSSAGAPDPCHFARMPLRRMTGEQLFDSLLQATGLHDAPARRGGALGDVESLRGEFQQKFSETSVARSEAETTILQALSLMNGRLVASATDLAQSETLAAVVAAPFLDRRQKVEMLFLSTLSRRPTPEESGQFAAYLASGTGADKTLAAKKSGTRSAAGETANDEPANDETANDETAGRLADIFWALLNSAEFVLVR